MEVITTEVTAVGTQVPPPKTGSSTTKRKREVLSRDEAVATGDSDGLSDDTIDEFVSSEEINSQDLQRTFSNCAKNDTQSKSFALPSMLTECDSESIVLIESKPSRVHGSVGSSGSATVGSLEQTPIDLSPENTPSDSTSLEFIKTSQEKSEYVPIEHTKNKITKEDARFFRDEYPKSDQEGVNNYGYEDRGKESTSPQAKMSRISDVPLSGSNDQSLSDDEWHLTLESSADEEIVPASEGLSSANMYGDSNAVCVDTSATPQAKRTKLNNDNLDRESSFTDTESETDSATCTSIMTVPTSGKCFHKDNDHCQDERQRSLSVEIIEPIVTAYIDLTQDYQSLSELSDATGNNEAPPTKVGDIVPKILTQNVCKDNDASSCIATDSLPHQSSNLERSYRHSIQLSKDNSLTDHNRFEPDTNIVGEEGPSPSVTVRSQTRGHVPIEECDTIDYEDHTPSSSFSGQSSPLFLPPTPGREGVDSILNRKNIAF